MWNVEIVHAYKMRFKSTLSQYRYQNDVPSLAFDANDFLFTLDFPLVTILNNNALLLPFA